jgi:hypothetical protein
MLRVTCACAVLLSLFACGDDEKRIAFSPGEFKVAELPPQPGAPFLYTVTGKFGVAEIFQGTTRVSILTEADRLVVFSPISDEPPRAVVWGNDRSEQKSLTARAAPELNPCGVLGTYEADYEFVTTALVPGTTCNYPVMDPLHAVVEITAAGSGVIDGEPLHAATQSSIATPFSDLTCAFFLRTLSATPLNSWVIVKVGDTQIDVWVDKNGRDVTEHPGCMARYHASFPLP